VPPSARHEKSHHLSHGARRPRPYNRRSAASAGAGASAQEKPLPRQRQLPAAGVLLRLQQEAAVHLPGAREPWRDVLQGHLRRHRAQLPALRQLQQDVQIHPDLLRGQMRQHLHRQEELRRLRRQVQNQVHQRLLRLRGVTRRARI
jgi:hypothetical protein